MNLLNDEPTGTEHEPMRAAAFRLELSMCDKFRQLREQRGWSQQDISDKLAEMGLEMHQTTVAKMEKGKRPLRVAEMFALSWVFGLPPGAVFWIPAKDDLPSSMKFMTERLASVDELQNQMRAEFLRMFESHLALYADLDSERASLVRAMRDDASMEPQQDRVAEGITQ
ncbi:helix-turn-helix domain-containing protein [Pseudarthrobacter psychrotolerans]|uniref:Helix-turn-helix domain-containing protein n=1 Tax=Pseudarthrobacter psychrotolerans TaxID=2697569 RepID=A0A6P1NHC1_9MICC|nr:helix-turn-helix transcriptional regulator [Pseudarthrobacter psychrotolerans]QHK19726.1 helix-turn-helix domain-containing protein [Pseudarthrobacter psychrotolerans]